MLMDLMGCMQEEMLLAEHIEGVIPLQAGDMENILRGVQTMFHEGLEMQILKFMIWVYNKMEVINSYRMSNLTLQAGKTVDS
ncbi:hypothetical protein MTR_8g009650 [Medicago truncatula]|uniref:Uncharacterized protein n=1 Tax=Medicago truncatula TaxID=3880 RepID=A0A072TKN4_MEDTR|nr:hypothetical protein MTR_8g009650 [Medicago truncatula]